MQETGEIKKEVIELLKKKQDLTDEIKVLEKKKSDIDFLTEHDKKVKGALLRAKTLKEKYNTVLSQNSALKERLDFILELDEYTPKQFNIRKKANPKGGEAIANLGTGDWHIEENVVKAEVQGLNEYNPGIAKARIIRMWEKFLTLVNIERYGVEINKVTVNILGDLISGYIHDDLMSTNTLAPSEATLLVEDLLFSGISYLLAHGKFTQIDVICHCGNHSRYTPGRKIHHKGQAKKTFEWIIYHQVAKTFRRLGDDRVNFVIPESSLYMNDQFGYNVRTSHGTSFNYQGGIGGESIPVNKKILRWNN